MWVVLSYYKVANKCDKPSLSNKFVVDRVTKSMNGGKNRNSRMLSRKKVDLCTQERQNTKEKKAGKRRSILKR